MYPFRVKLWGNCSGWYYSKFKEISKAGFDSFPSNNDVQILIQSWGANTRKHDFVSIIDFSMPTDRHDSQLPFQQAWNNMDRKQIHKSEKHWANSVSSGYKYIPISFSFFFERLIYLRKRESPWWGGGERELQADSLMSVRPVAGLHVRTLRSWPGPNGLLSKRFTDWATQVSQVSQVWCFCCCFIFF